MNTPNKKKKLLHQNELIKVSAEEETGFWRFFRLNAHETKVTLHCVEGLLRPAETCRRSEPAGRSLCWVISD